MSDPCVEIGFEEASSERGVSLVEIIIVLAVLMVMTAVSLPYLFNNTRMYRTEDQAIKVMDLMREAGQLALTRRRNIRVEMDRTNVASPVLRMIDENGAAADVLIKTIPLHPLSEVRMDIAPAGIAPPAPANYPAAVYTANVWVARFRSDGSVVNAADTPISATLFSWRPINETATPFNIASLNPARREETRAITLFGGSGAVRYWKYTGTAFVASK